MDEQPIDGINVVPLVDIMLVLLTIVLTTSSFIASGRIPLNLPQASRSASESPASTMIEIAADGAINFNGKALSPEALRSALEPLPRDTAFIIRADKKVSLQHFIDVADILKQLSFSKVAVQTEMRK